MRALIVAIVLLTVPATVVRADAEDKARYVGGTLRDFPKGGLGAQIQPTILGTVDIGTVEGRIDTKSESDLLFDARGKGVLTIPYRAIVGLTYGLEPHGMSRGGLFLITWDPLDQYGKKAHYLLSIRYLDEAGAEQDAVFELGKGTEQRTLSTLEARTGKSIECPQVEACLLYKTAEACDYGTPAELRGLTRIFVDAGASNEHRDMIVSEIEKARLGLEVMVAPEQAEVVLRFRGAEFRRPDFLQALHGGRGEAFLLRDGRLRAVMVFAGTRTGAWGAKPATKFAAAFVQAYRKANTR